MMCYTDWMTLVEKDDGRADELWVLTDEDLWLAGKTLKVRFLDDRIPAWPNDGRGHITEEEILKIANEWHQCGVEQGKDVVPEFVPCGADDTADIRVKFIGNYTILIYAYLDLFFLLMKQAHTAIFTTNKDTQFSHVGIICTCSHKCHRYGRV